jgi:hypothetical protein
MSRTARRAAHRLAARIVVSAVAALLAATVFAQPPGPRPAGPPPSPRDSAPIDLTGQWVSIVNEDWRWRMVTPPKGDYASVLTLNAAGRAVADAWDPSQDGSCKVYGAAGLLRMPTRLRIRWQSDSVLEIETDAGRQTRRFGFAAPGAPEPPAAEPSLQGTSVAQWNRTLPRAGAMGFAGPGGAPREGGSLQVTTRNLLPGWLRRNGVPYSERTELTEFFDWFQAPNGDEWLVATTIVQDPVYHFERYITSSHFRRETDDSRWSPSACRAD